ncbi:MAG TPA: aldose 1-epimerase family protein [Pseudoflavonifractor sp.]|nr:aldose 1-epimerase family protein [Pseudoflavonifractor sp.]
MNGNYLDQLSQVCGVEEHRLVGGRGDGMRLFEVRNGLGLEFTVSADRCADLSRLSFLGRNCGFFSMSGYVHPSYYDGVGKGSEKSFTGGFLATCGLSNVGAPCVDEGEDLPLHGAVGNLPAERIFWDMDEENITIKAVVAHGGFFADKLVLTRTITCSRTENTLRLSDRVKNVGDRTVPLMLLYHINLGYPLLSERARLYIPSAQVTPRDPRAAEGMDAWSKVEPPQAGFKEQCYFHRFDDSGAAGLYNPELGQGLMIRFDPEELPCFTQWKMMGRSEYVMGLEPGNCYPGGRLEERRQGRLQTIAPGEERRFTLCFELSTAAPAF